MARTASGALWTCRICDRSRRYIHRVWLASPKRPARQRGTCRWSRSLVFVPKLILVADGRYCGRFFGLCLRIHEHGKPGWSSAYSLFDSLDCSAIRLDDFISRGFRLVPFGGCELVTRGSVATTDYATDCGCAESASHSAERF